MSAIENRFVQRLLKNSDKNHRMMTRNVGHRRMHFFLFLQLFSCLNTGDCELIYSADDDAYAYLVKTTKMNTLYYGNFNTLFRELGKANK